MSDAEAQDTSRATGDTFYRGNEAERSAPVIYHRKIFTYEPAIHTPSPGERRSSVPVTGSQTTQVVYKGKVLDQYQGRKTQLIIRNSPASGNLTSTVVPGLNTDQVVAMNVPPTQAAEFQPSGRSKERKQSFSNYIRMGPAPVAVLPQPVQQFANGHQHGQQQQQQQASSRLEQRLSSAGIIVKPPSLNSDDVGLPARPLSLHVLHKPLVVHLPEGSVPNNGAVAAKPPMPVQPLTSRSLLIPPVATELQQGIVPTGKSYPERTNFTGSYTQFITEQNKIKEHVKKAKETANKETIVGTVDVDGDVVIEQEEIINEIINEVPRDGASSGTGNSTTVSTEDDPEEFILEEGGSDNFDVSYDMFPDEEEDEDDTDTTSSSVISVQNRDLFRLSLTTAPQPPPPLEWYIEQMLNRVSNVEGSAVRLSANKSNKDGGGAVQLEIRRGRVMQGDVGNFITVMSRMDCFKTLEQEIEKIKNQPDETWTPAVRKARLKSVEVVAGDSKTERQSLKRKWDSLFDLQLDEEGQYKRPSPLNLLCEETIVENSSDDLSDAERSNDNNAESVILMPASAHLLDVEMKSNGSAEGRAIKLEPIDFEAYQPMMVDEKPPPEMILMNVLEETKMKVRECFRPTELGPEPNGFDFMRWQENDGSLYGSNLQFFINDIGLMDLKDINLPGRFTSLWREPKVQNGYSALPPPLPQRNDDDVQGTGARFGNGPNGLGRGDSKEDPFWEAHMERRGTFAAPSYMFKHMLAKEHKLKMNMLVEIINPEHPDQLVVGCVEQFLGGRVRIRIRHGEVVHLNSNAWNLFPRGFGVAMGLDVASYLPTERRNGAKYVWPDMEKRLRSWKSPFKLKQQVEALDCCGCGQLRAATIYRIIKNHVLIVFDEDVDGLTNSKVRGVPKSSFWCADDSPLIRPVNYHKMVGRPLVMDSATWGQQMARRQTSAAPASAFRTRKPVPFRVGMQLEVVDRVSPQVLRPATVTTVAEYEIQLRYDGFPEKSYAVWTMDDSEDLYPIRSNSQRKHHLAVVDANADVTCSTGFCGDLCNRPAQLNRKKKRCTYLLPDFYHDFQKDIAVAARQTRFPKMAMNGASKKLWNREVERETVSQPPPLVVGDMGKVAKLEKKIADQHRMISELSAIRDYGPSHKPAVEWWTERSSMLSSSCVPKQYQTTQSYQSPLRWTPRQVENYINGLPNCRHLGSVFKMNDIDGEAFLSLKKTDLMDEMNLKHGVVVKVYNAILSLRSLVVKLMFKEDGKGSSDKRK